MISQYMKVLIWAFIFGVAAGGLLAISIKYPLNYKELTEATNMCKSHKGLESLRVGLSGKVYSVTCKDKKSFEIK